MNLLFDFLTVHVKSGAGEYQRRVFYEMMNYIQLHNKEIKVYALYDSSIGIAYDDLKEEPLRHQYDITFLDCKERHIDELVKDYQIDRFFIACAPFFCGRAEIANLNCDVICVIHDLCYEENYKDKIYFLFDLIEPGSDNPAKFSKLGCIRNINPFKKILDHFDVFALRYIMEGGHEMHKYYLDNNKPAINMYRNNPNVRIVTVSEYSKRSLMYFFDVKETDISVLYSPERINVTTKDYENKQLEDVIGSNKKYYLMVSADRRAKNPHKTINAFAKYAKSHPDYYLLTLGYGQKVFENHIPLPFLCDSDLAYAYANCYALIYPSFFEGFGYPPIEAMHWGKPVLCSNTTSMPEVLADAPIYFSPFYESGIYGALCSLTDENYSYYVEKSITRYNRVKEFQERDLINLIRMITDDSDK